MYLSFNYIILPFYGSFSSDIVSDLFYYLRFENYIRKIMVGVILKNRKAGKMFLIHRFTII